MCYRTILLSSFFILFLSNGLSAQSAEEAAPKDGLFSHPSFSALGSYTDFNFDSTEGASFNRFSGYSRLYSLGAGSFKINKDTSFGLALFRVDTAVNSQVLFNPGAVVASHQTTRNNTLFGHVLKQFSSQVFLDLAGAYGQNKVNSQSIYSASQIGYATNNSSNWFMSLTGFYGRNWNKWVLNTNARVLYSQMNSGSYPFSFQSNTPVQIVAPLTNKVWFLMENAELAYNFERRVMPLTPFINAGLIQVLKFSNSRAIVNTPINGISPQLNMNKGGYRLGTGLSYNYKQFTVRLEEQYYSSGNTYRSYQTLLGLRYSV